VSQVFGGSDFGSASGVRPARAPGVAAGGELAVLRRVCLPAAGRRLKTWVLGCCGAERSAVVVVEARDAFLGKRGGSVASVATPT